MPKFMLDGKEYGGGSDSSIEITQAKYDELVQSNSIQKDVTYYITDSKDEFDASFVKYDNTESGLEATDVQSAISELNYKIDNYEPIQEQSGTVLQFSVTPYDGDDEMLITFPEVFNTVPTDFTCVEKDQISAITCTLKEITRSYAIVNIHSTAGFNSVNDFNWKAVAYNDEQNKNLEWKVCGTKTGTDDMTLPSTFSELLIHVNIPDDDYSWTIHVLKNMLKSTERFFSNGFYFTEHASGASEFYISTSKIRLGDAYFCGNGKSDVCSYTVYYK